MNNKRKMKLLNNKQGQITIFIILGILMIIGSVLVLNVREKVLTSKDFDDFVTEAPSEVRPVKEFIERCMHDVSKQAVILVGENGGYVTQDNILSPIFDFPTSGEGIEIVEGTGIVIPYYLYLDGPNECQTLGGKCRMISGFIDEGGLIPPLSKSSIDDLSIENQISNYVEKKLPECIDNFRSLKDVGYNIKQISPPMVDTVISKDVKLKLKYPIEITKGDSVTELEYYSTKLDVDLKNAYYLALFITNQERNKVFLEEMVANMITAFGGVDKKIPPQFGGIDYDASSPMRTWDEFKIKKELEKILSVHVNRLKVTNTRSLGRVMPLKEDEDEWDFLVRRLNYLVNLGTDLVFDLDVKFMYLPTWNIFLDVNPSKGPLVMPERSNTEFLSYLGLGFTRYDFSYDVSFPVLVKISDDEAFNGEGFEYYFALEANYRNNQALMSENSDNYKEPIEEDRSVNLICQEEREVTGNITVNTFDALTEEPLSNVDVVSSFAKRACSKGYTTAGKEKNVFTGRFPKGIGYLSLKKYGYLDHDMFYIFAPNKTENITANLWPEKKINVILTKKMLSKSKGWKVSRVEDFNENDNVIITLERLKDERSRQDIKETLLFMGDMADGYNKTLELFPGKYIYTIVYFNKDNFTVPEDEVCYTKGGLFTSEEECEDVPSVSLPLSATVEIDESDEEVYYLDLDGIYYKNYLEFRVLVPDFYKEQNSLKHKDLEIMSNLDTYFKRQFSTLRPDLK